MNKAHYDKLRKVMAESYTAMNADGRFARAALQDLTLFRSLRDAVLPREVEPAVLDFGCGPHGGISHVVRNVTAYDPYAPAYAADPWERRYRVVYSCDVLEHMLATDVLQFLRRVDVNGAALLYLEVATRPATKTLSNGLNAHVTIKPASWWAGFVQGVLSERYSTLVARDDFHAGVCTLALHRNKEKS